MKRTLLANLMTVVLALVVVVALVAPASAQLYGGVKGGAFFPNDDEDGLEGFDTGFGVEAFAAYRLTRNFALEGAVGYYQSKASESGLLIEQTATASAVPLTLTAKAYLPAGPAGRLYAGAGVGAYFSEVDLEISMPGFGTRSSDTSTDTAFGYHAVVGGEYLFSPRWGLLAEAKWFRAEPETSLELFGESFDGEKVDIGGVVLSVGLLFQ